MIDLPEAVPEILVRFVAKQIEVDPTVFTMYAKRDPTRREHLEEIRKEFGYRSFQLNDYRDISHTLLQYALENGNSMYLIQTAIDLLRQKKIILPALPTIERLVWETRKRAEKKIFMLLTKSLYGWQKRKLDELIAVSNDGKKTPLTWLKRFRGNHHQTPF